MNPEDAQELAQIVAKELTTESRSASEKAATSEIRDADIQIEITVSGSAGFFPGFNLLARDWAAEHAGKSWSDISELTRTRIRQIVTRSFEKKTALSRVVEEIRCAGDFSEARAASIARTEISMARVGSNLKVWTETGIVKKIRWLAVGRDCCPICRQNNGEEREIGQKFSDTPLTSSTPTAHVSFAPCCK